MATIVGPVRFGRHGRLRLAERGFDPVWIERLLDQPDWTVPDPSFPDRVRVFGLVPKLGQILRVVIERAQGGGWEIVTIFPDRHAWKRRPR